MLRALAAADPPVRAQADLWREAQTAGIEIPVPPPELRPFTPSYGESGRPFNHSEFAFAPLDDDALVVEASSVMDLGAAGQQSFMHAARRAGLAERLYQGIRGFAGFAWYDALPKLTKIELHATMEDGREHRIECEEPDDGEWLQGRATRVAVHCTIEEDGESRELVLPSDVALGGHSSSWFPGNEEQHIVVTADAEISLSKLADLIMDSFFDPSDDYDADSYESQKERFSNDAYSWALELLVSTDEAIAAEAVHDAATTCVAPRATPRRRHPRHQGRRDQGSAGSLAGAASLGTLRTRPQSWPGANRLSLTTEP